MLHQFQLQLQLNQPKLGKFTLNIQEEDIYSQNLHILNATRNKPSP